MHKKRQIAWAKQGPLMRQITAAGKALQKRKTS
jgi:hypothetical protein